MALGDPGARARRRRSLGTAGCLVVAAWALGVDPARASRDFRDWDHVFARDERGEPGDWCAHPARGWRVADGGFSAWHSRTNRSIWLFGDTKVAEPLPHQANTIAVARSDPPHAAPTDGIEFYGRSGSGIWPRTIAMGANASAWTRAWMPTSRPDQWYWPLKPIIPEGSDRLYSFWGKYECIDGRAPPCLTGLRLSRYPRVCVVESVEGAPTGWPDPVCADLRHPDSDRAPFEDGLRWGSGLSEVGSYLYVYGSTLVEPYERATPHEVVLARATQDTLLDYAQWEFLKTTGSSGEWRTGPPTSPDELSVVADHASQYFTVDRIEIDGTAAWVMVQSSVDELTDLIVRIAPDEAGGTSWSSLPDQSDDQTRILSIGGPDGIDPPCTDLYGPALVAYHATGHWHLSNQAEHRLMVGYFCLGVDHGAEPGHDVTPWDFDRDGTCDADDPRAYLRPADPEDFLAGRLRFTELDLQALRPWCTTGCETP